MKKSKNTNKLRDYSKRFIAFLGSRRFLYLVFAWFTFQLVFMALSTARGIPPDEGTHLGSIRLYSGNGFDPFIQNQPADTYKLGQLSRAPSYMYYYIMSFPHRLIPNNFVVEDELMVLRLLNLVFAIGGLVVLYRALALITKRTIVLNMTLFMLTNTLMFTFLSSSVNYDNLVFLSVNIVLYYFIRIFRKYSLPDLLKLAMAMMFTSLVKFTFLPLGVLFLGMLLVRHRRNVKEIWQQTRKDVASKSLRKPLIILSIFTVLFLGLFAERYGLNYVRYGTHKPQCDQVLTYNQCLNNALFKRNLAFRDNPVTERIPTPDFMIRWTERMKEGIFGILGHKFADETGIIKHGSLVIFGVIAVAIAWNIRRGEAIVNYLLFIAVAYTVMLMVGNYALYSKSDRFGLALQGRYVFPVIALYYFAGLYYLDLWLKPRAVAQALFSAFIIFVFLAGSLPAYVYSTNATWRMPLMRTPNAYLKQAIRLVTPGSN